MRVGKSRYYYIQNRQELNDLLHILRPYYSGSCSGKVYQRVFLEIEDKVNFAEAGIYELEYRIYDNKEGYIVTKVKIKDLIEFYNNLKRLFEMVDIKVD